MTGDPVLVVKNLVKHYGGGAAGLFDYSPLVRAVKDVSLTVEAGRTLAIVGETGCGKSTLARMIALLTPPTDGIINLDGETVGAQNIRSMRPKVQMVFQDPFAALNPRMTAARIIAEPLVVQKVGTGHLRRQKIYELADAVGLSSSDLDRYPHQFSGGQRQRIAIARALALSPKLVVADEPTSALDVSVQSQVLNLFGELKARLGLSYLFISHDLSVVHHMADRVAVMYLGHMVEIAERDALFATPSHPYTRALIDAAPAIGPKRRPSRDRKADEAPNQDKAPLGCAYAPRCPLADDHCRSVQPKLTGSAPHQTACHHAGVPMRGHP